LTIFAWNYWSLYAGTLLFGIANGSVEAACNPLIATLYPADKTTKLNHFHVWFPGGIVIGSLLAFAMGRQMGLEGAVRQPPPAARRLWRDVSRAGFSPD